MFARPIATQRFRTHQNRTKDIIKIVSYATRQGTNAFKSLRAQQLHFKFLLLSNVRVDEEQRARLPSGIANEGGAAVDNDIPGTFRDLLKFAMKFAGREQNF